MSLLDLINKLGRCFLISMLFFWNGGCSTEYNLVTGRRDIMLYSVDREVTLGALLAKQLEKRYPPVKDEALQDKISKIGQKLVQVCDRKDISYSFKVIDFPGKNAISLPGGYVYISKELVDFCDSDDEIASVLAHEIGHIVARHNIKKLQASNIAMVALLGAGISGNRAVINGLSLALDSLFSAYSQEDEFLADYLGAKYMKKAGYKVSAMVKLFSKLENLQRYNGKLEPLSYFRTHPFLAERIARIKHHFLGGDNAAFLDYINRH